MKVTEKIQKHIFQQKLWKMAVSIEKDEALIHDKEKEIRSGSPLQY